MRHQSTVVICATCLLSLFGVPGGCLPDPDGSGKAEPNDSAVVRVVTYNTQCIVPEMDESLLAKISSAADDVVNCLGDIGGFIVDPVKLALIGIDVVNPFDFRDEAVDRSMQRAKDIVKYIKEHPDVDILALNEVFLEDARSYFVSQLKGDFPYYVERVVGGTPCTEDSGLMLFSRFPFMSLPPSMMPGGDFLAEAMGIPWPSVAFTEFEDCNCEDCLAEKAAAYVRIQNPNSGDIYHVVWTHMQADPVACVSETYDTDIWTTRDSQLKDIENLIGAALGPDGYTGNTTVMVMGDMNVQGTQYDAAVAAGLSPQDLWEYGLKFDPTLAAGHYLAGDPYTGAGTLYDTWARTTSPWDPGVSHPESSRYDYIFMNSVPGAADRRLIPQHMTIWANSSMSDHLGIHAVINQHSQYCTPVEARAPQQGLNAATWSNDQYYSGKITVAGAYQWFRFDIPGTYSFSLESSSGQNDASAFDMRVYTHTDLTFDVSNYYGEETDVSEYFPPPPSTVGLPQKTIIAKKYVIPEAPFYVRISPKAIDGSGDYVLYVHRHEGRSKKDAVVLSANCTQPYFHGTAYLNTEDMPWFQFNTENADSGALQSIRCIVMWRTAKGPGPLELRFQDNNDTVVVNSASMAAISSPSVNDNDPAYGTDTPVYYAEVTYEGPESLGNRFFLRVQRPSTAYDTYLMRWETNLTVLHGYVSTETRALRLDCDDETCYDSTGSDEISLEVWADGKYLYPVAKNAIGSSDVDSGDTYSLEGLIHPVRFVNKFTLKVLEHDDGSPDVGNINIGVLAPSLSKSWKKSSSASVPCSGAGSDGDYAFKYNLSRSLECACE